MKIFPLIIVLCFAIFNKCYHWLNTHFYEQYICFHQLSSIISTNGYNSNKEHMIIKNLEICNDQNEKKKIFFVRLFVNVIIFGCWTDNKKNRKQKPTYTEKKSHDHLLYTFNCCFSLFSFLFSFSFFIFDSVLFNDDHGHDNDDNWALDDAILILQFQYRNKKFCAVMVNGVWRHRRRVLIQHVKCCIV